MHHQPLGKPWLRRPKCKPPSLPPSLPLAALQAWSTIMTGKSHKTKGTVPSENTTTVTKQKKLLPLRCLSSNPKPQIHHSFPTTTPPLPTFFVVLLLLPLQFLSIQAESSSLPWPLFLADHARFRRPTIAHFRFSFSFA